MLGYGNNVVLDPRHGIDTIYCTTTHMLSYKLN